MNFPVITVIIPAYNHAHFIAQTIKSVISQTYLNIELIILNDGSSDNTSEVVKGLESECKKRFSRFEYIDKQNEGLAETLNRGLAWSKGEFITLMASDDVMMPERVQVLFEALSEKDETCGIAIADAKFINDSGEIISMTDSGGQGINDQGFNRFVEFFTRRRNDININVDLFNYDLLIKGNFIPAMSVMMRKAALIDVGSFTPGVALEDWDLWLRMARSYKGVYVDKAVSYYRMHETNSVKTIVPKLLEGQVFVLKRELEIVGGDNKEYRNLLARWIRADSFRLVKRKKYQYFKDMFSLKLLWKSCF